jgi:hypothetical protein
MGESRREPPGRREKQKAQTIMVTSRALFPGGLDELSRIGALLNAAPDLDPCPRSSAWP